MASAWYILMPGCCSQSCHVGRAVFLCVPEHEWKLTTGPGQCQFRAQCPRCQLVIHFSMQCWLLLVPLLVNRLLPHLYNLLDKLKQRWQKKPAARHERIIVHKQKNGDRYHFYNPDSEDSQPQAAPSGAGVTQHPAAPV